MQKNEDMLVSQPTRWANNFVCQQIENLIRVDVVSTGDYWNEFGEDTTYQLHFWPDEKIDEFNYTKSKHSVKNEAVMKEQSTRN